jgi:hypothetical protein
MADSTDLFPLNVYFPIEEDAVDRKVRLQMASGKWHIRAQGTDQTVWNLRGECSIAERKTFLDFYESHAVCGCTLRDADYDPAEDHVVQFTARPEVSRPMYGHCLWQCQLVETTVA